MRYTKMHFHHVPGHEHTHPHGHCHDHGCDHDKTAAQGGNQTLQLLEYLHHHNEEHALELASYQDTVDNAEAAGLIAESVEFLNKSNEKLGEAIDALRKEA